MNWLSANLDALELTDPALARRLNAIESGDRGLWSPSRTGQPAVRRAGVSLSSAFDPAAEAARAVPLWDESVDFVVLPGLGAGYLAEAVANRYADLPLVVAEADPRWLVEVLTHRDLRSLLSLRFVTFLLGPEPSVVGDFLSPFSCRRVEILDWRPLADQEPLWRREVAGQIASAQARARVNVATYRRFGRLWQRNLHKNEALARNVRPLSALAGCCRGMPAVVAAAGPSLGESFAWMKTYRERFVLIAVDTASAALAYAGLEPDFLLVLDGQYRNARHVDQAPPEKTLVVTEWTGPSRAFRLAPGRTFVAASSIPFLRPREQELWGALGALPSGGSVATAAWSLALLLGCGEVAFAGLDLGFPNGQTHAPGSQFEEELHRRSCRLTPAETLGLALLDLSELVPRTAVDGGQVLSDARMDLFRGWLSASVSGHSGVKVVNLGHRGSLISGLVSPPLGYGEDWPAASPAFSETAPLTRRKDQRLPPPFDALRRLIGAEDFSLAVSQAWAAAQAYWGTEIWKAWAGRAASTWQRFPSARSRLAIVEVVELALTWEGFWVDESSMSLSGA